MANVSNWEKFKLLVWKNFSLQWNHKVQFVVQVLLPVLFSFLLVLVRSLVNPEHHDTVTFGALNVTNFELLERNIEKSTPLPTYYVYYSPENDYIDKIVAEAASALKLEGYKGFSDAVSLENALMESIESPTPVLAGIQFDDTMAGLTDFPELLDYSLRFPSSLRTGGTNMQVTWYTMLLSVPVELSGPRNVGDDDGGVPPGYMREGFITLQNAVSMAYIKLAAKVQDSTLLPDIQMQRYPYPPYTFDPLLAGLASMFALIIILAFIYSVTTLTKSITEEKERQLKEVMKIMGLQNWIHWAAWFVKAFTQFAISAILISAVIKINWQDGVGILTHSSWSVVFFFLLIYIINAICFCFMMSVFFSRASTAAAVTGLFWFIAYLPYSFTTISINKTSLSAKVGFSLLLNSALGFGSELILGFEGTGEGLQWNNLFETYSLDEECSMAAIIGMMLLSSVIYLLICLYVEQILPGNYGVPKKWYFPVSKSFWCGKNDNSFESAYGKWDHMMDNKRRNPEAFEAEPTDKQVGVQVHNLRKNFGNKTAVNGLSINMYEDEITVLLGHNGAGKTTTISMLTGMFPPTEGTAKINGYDIRTQTEEARASMGICPQHNVLFEDMSVANHIVFYSRLKGMRDEEIKKEVDKYLKMIELEDKANAPASSLSGGMKRKLSVCCALCGGTKVVLCDEPSSGMDPAARRQLWELLQAEKVGRTLLLTTHFMDEADVLGDRIAIMCGGDLKCHGTSFFLKKKFGSGYRLICVKHESCDVSRVTELLQTFVPNIMPESDIGAELSYQLPDDYSGVFEELFKALESQSEQLHLNGYGISITSMEEVFLKVGAEGSDTPKEKIGLNDKENGLSLSNIMDIEGHSSNDNTFGDTTRLLQGTSLMANQWKAMFQKKMLYTYRNKLMFCIQNLIPIFFVSMAIYLSRSQGIYRPLPAINLNLTQYPYTVTVLETDNSIVSNSLEAKVAQQYESFAKSYGAVHTFESTGMETFHDYILSKGKDMQVRVNSRYLASATIGAGKITAWLQNQPFHAAPLTINMVHNALAKALIGENAEIRITNAPLPYTTIDKINQVNNGNSVGAQLGMNVSFCMAFICAIYVLFVIKERESRSKLLQFVSGTNIWTFWITQFLWDLLTFVLTALITVCTIACFQEDGYSTFEELGYYFSLFLIFGVGMLPFTYFLSFFSTEPASGFAKVSIINIFGGMALYITMIVLSLDLLGTDDVADVLIWICRIFPHFSLAWAMNSLNINIATRTACEAFANSETPPFCSNIPDYFAWSNPGILPEVVYLLGLGLILFMIIILKEYQVMGELMKKVKSTIKKPPQPPPESAIDDDVAREKQRIAKMSASELQTQNLVLDQVTKFYDKFLAVNQISLGIKQMECFGLLGVNGAGKTTTFKMMTGDESITYGDAYVKGMSLKSDMNEIYSDIGYCPQFDALLDDLTGRETLRIFCLLRGIHTERINSLSEELARCFGFRKHLDKPTCAYSGGNKRKLSTAISVIGSPSVIFLDEPTTGMDPASRRQLWNMVCRIRDSGKSIVLTSHSMEECEALCTRLAIMVNGEFKCIGSTQHLKNKFSKGLVLKIKVKKEGNKGMSARDITIIQRASAAFDSFEERVESVKRFVSEEFPESVLQEAYQGILTFYIPLTSIKWSRAFGSIERSRDSLNIEDYSISQTTLEEIFLEFAKHQHEDKRLFK